MQYFDEPTASFMLAKEANIQQWENFAKLRKIKYYIPVAFVM